MDTSGYRQTLQDQQAACLSGASQMIAWLNRIIARRRQAAAAKVRAQREETIAALIAEAEADGHRQFPSERFLADLDAAQKIVRKHLT